jgi:hypothetical protein
MAKRWSIDFSEALNLDPDPLPRLRDHYLPEDGDGPITTVVEIEIAPENHRQFFKLAKELRLAFLRNGAFTARLDQDLENPKRFRLYSMVDTWAANQRLSQRITRDDHALWSEIWQLDVGAKTPRPKRYLGIQHWLPEEAAASRLKPAPGPKSEGSPTDMDAAK